MTTAVILVTSSVTCSGSLTLSSTCLSRTGKEETELSSHLQDTVVNETKEIERIDDCVLKVTKCSTNGREEVSLTNPVPFDTALC